MVARHWLHGGGKSYSFGQVVVRRYQHTKYLSVPKEGALIMEIEDV